MSEHFSSSQLALEALSALQRTERWGAKHSPSAFTVTRSGLGEDAET